MTVSEAIDNFRAGRRNRRAAHHHLGRHRARPVGLAGQRHAGRCHPALYDLETRIIASRRLALIEDWRRLQTSDHFYYMCTKWFNDGDIHAYFSPYETPYEAYINFMNVYRDLQSRWPKKVLRYSHAGGYWAGRVLSNGQIFVGLDENGLVHDFYYPYVGLENLTTARSTQHKIGVWVTASSNGPMTAAGKCWSNTRTTPWSAGSSCTPTNWQSR